MNDELIDDRYYWVRSHSEEEWQPAHWYDGYWWVTGSEVQRERDRYDQWVRIKLPPDTNDEF